MILNWFKRFTLQLGVLCKSVVVKWLDMYMWEVWAPKVKGRQFVLSFHLVSESPHALLIWRFLHNLFEIVELFNLTTYESNSGDRSKHPESFIWRSWSQDGPRWACKVTSFFLKRDALAVLLRNMCIVSDHAWQIVLFPEEPMILHPPQITTRQLLTKLCNVPYYHWKSCTRVYHLYAAYALDAFLYNEAWKLDVLDLLFMVGPQCIESRIRPWCTVTGWSMTVINSLIISTLSDIV